MNNSYLECCREICNRLFIYVSYD